MTRTVSSDGKIPLSLSSCPRKSDVRVSSASSSRASSFCRRALVEGPGFPSVPRKSVRGQFPDLQAASSSARVSGFAADAFRVSVCAPAAFVRLMGPSLVLLTRWPLRDVLLELFVQAEAVSVVARVALLDMDRASPFRMRFVVVLLVAVST